MSETIPDDLQLIRQILDQGSRSALWEIIDRYRPQLMRHALRWLKKLPALRTCFEAEDLVGDFLNNKVLPEDRHQAIFGPVGNAGGPYRSWLLACFGNFVRDKWKKETVRAPASPSEFAEPQSTPRRPQRRHPVIHKSAFHKPNEDDNSDELFPDKGQSNAEEDAEEIAIRIPAQLAALRRLIAAVPGRIPFGAILILSERVLLAEEIVAAFGAEEQLGFGDPAHRKRTESLSQWTAAEEEILLPPRSIRLGEVWRELCRGSRGGGQGIAGVLGINATTWLKWVQRGREHLTVLLGPATTRMLFPYWPASLFERAERAGREETP